jgi:phage terminase small subunit
MHPGDSLVAQNPAAKPSPNVVNYASSVPKPPKNLGPAGTRLWRAILAEYDIPDAGGLALLEQAAFAYERAERVRAQIDAEGEIVRTERGVREHPGLKIELASRSFVVRTLQRLGINLEAIRPASGQRPKPSWADHANE